MCGNPPARAALLFPYRFLIRFHCEMDLREGCLCWGCIDTDQHVYDARCPWVRNEAARLAPMGPCARGRECGTPNPAWLQRKADRDIIHRLPLPILDCHQYGGDLGVVGCQGLRDRPKDDSRVEDLDSNSIRRVPCGTQRRGRAGQTAQDEPHTHQQQGDTPYHRAFPPEGVSELWI